MNWFAGVKNFFWWAFASLVLLSGGAIAAQPTYIGNNAAANTYCYDFNNYIPANDSPVVGGWTQIATNSSDPGYCEFGCDAPGHYFVRSYGKVCAKTHFSYSAPNANFVLGRLLYYSAPTGEWYYGGVSTAGFNSQSTGWVNTGPLENMPLGASCPHNTAAIKVNGYQRTDGGELIPSIHLRDITKSHLHGWVAPLSRQDVFQRIDYYVCVKTDTTQ